MEIKKLKKSEEDVETAERARYVNRIIGASQKLVIASILDVARSSLLVLITGPTGTGKSLAAKAIHEESDRKNQPFVQINCGAIPENLIETELYGHVKGAFTGADRDRKGLFAAAGGGTIFLDEIGDMPMQQQKRLLDVLDNMEFRQVGSEARIPVKARIIAATNKNLKQLIDEEKFRQDLFYRLDVLRIDLLPLRMRKNDIPELIDFFIEKFKAEHPLHANVSSEAIARMKRTFPYMPWEGNVRELAHTIIRRNLQGETPEEKETSMTFLDFIDGLPLNIKEGTRILEKEIIRKGLEKNSGNKTKTAKEIGLSVPALLYKMAEYGLS